MTTSPPPDLSSLSLSSQRLHDTYDYDATNAVAKSHYHFHPSPFIQTPVKKQPPRAGLPTQWLEASQDHRSLSPNNNSDFSSSGGSPPIPHLSANLNPSSANTPTPVASAALQSILDDEIIPTAIVIKNIPFNVKRETLLDIIASLSIPTPYAFNYHLDQQGAFRGLAFANFRQASDADAVVAALNGFDVQGRKLRVEYKKVLQAGEKERIEREKAIRRMRSMQIEKEHQHQVASAPAQYDDFGLATNSAFVPQRSFSSGSAYQQHPYSPPSVSPMPLAQPYTAPAAPARPPTPTASDRATNELDLNEPSTLEIYSRILLFKDDPMRDELAFSRTLTPQQRRIVHLVAQKLGVYHYSIGEGDERYAVVTRTDPNRQRSTVRHTLSRVPSAYLSPTSLSQAPPSLRVKKSMPDMKTLHSSAPRLSSRSSNGNIRDGFATLATPTRRISTNFSSLFGNNSGFGGSSIPPVPSLPSSAASLNGGGAGSGTSGVSTTMGGTTYESSPSSVVRQPRGPGVGGFSLRSARVVASEPHSSRSGFEAQSYEPLEL